MTKFRKTVGTVLGLFGLLVIGVGISTIITETLDRIDRRYVARCTEQGGVYFSHHHNHLCLKDGVPYDPKD